MTDSEDEWDCPLCMEEMDDSDRNFRPCPCGYQICRFCWHHIKENLNGLCPACRRLYSDDTVEFIPVSTSGKDSKIKGKDKRTKKLKDPFHPNIDFDGVNSSHGSLPVSTSSSSSTKKSPATLRVIQKNLVYVIGLCPKTATEDALMHSDYFGQFGKILKIVVNKRNYSGPSSATGSSTTSASCYVTFARKEDAARAIATIDGAIFDGRIVRASFGTTKYCTFFLRGIPCQNPGCMYLHEMGEEHDSFTKHEMQIGKHLNRFAPVANSDSSKFVEPVKAAVSRSLPVNNQPSSGGKLPCSTIPNSLSPSALLKSAEFSFSSAALSTPGKQLASSNASNLLLPVISSATEVGGSSSYSGQNSLTTLHSTASNVKKSQPSSPKQPSSISFTGVQFSISSPRNSTSPSSIFDEIAPWRPIEFSASYARSSGDTRDFSFNPFREETKFYGSGLLHGDDLFVPSKDDPFVLSNQLSNASLNPIGSRSSSALNRGVNVGAQFGVQPSSSGNTLPNMCYLSAAQHTLQTDWFARDSLHIAPTYPIVDNSSLVASNSSDFQESSMNNGDLGRRASSRFDFAQFGLSGIGGLPFNHIQDQVSSNMQHKQTTAFNNTTRQDQQGFLKSLFPGVNMTFSQEQNANQGTPQQSHLSYSDHIDSNCGQPNSTSKNQLLSNDAAGSFCFTNDQSLYNNQNERIYFSGYQQLPVNNHCLIDHQHDGSIVDKHKLSNATAVLRTTWNQETRPEIDTVKQHGTIYKSDVHVISSVISDEQKTVNPPSSSDSWNAKSQLQHAPASQANEFLRNFLINSHSVSNTANHIPAASLPGGFHDPAIMAALPRQSSAHSVHSNDLHIYPFLNGNSSENDYLVNYRTEVGSRYSELKSEKNASQDISSVHSKDVDVIPDIGYKALYFPVENEISSIAAASEADIVHNLSASVLNSNNALKLSNTGESERQTAFANTGSNGAVDASSGININVVACDLSSDFKPATDLKSGSINAKATSSVTLSSSNSIPNATGRSKRNVNKDTVIVKQILKPPQKSTLLGNEKHDLKVSHSETAAGLSLQADDDIKFNLVNAKQVSILKHEPVTLKSGDDNDLLEDAFAALSAASTGTIVSSKKRSTKIKNPLHRSPAKSQITILTREKATKHQEPDNVSMQAVPTDIISTELIPAKSEISSGRGLSDSKHVVSPSIIRYDPTTLDVAHDPYKPHPKLFRYDVSSIGLLVRSLCIFAVNVFPTHLNAVFAQHYMQNLFFPDGKPDVDTITNSTDQEFKYFIWSTMAEMHIREIAVPFIVCPLQIVIDAFADATVQLRLERLRCSGPPANLDDVAFDMIVELFFRKLLQDRAALSTDKPDPLHVVGNMSTIPCASMFDSISLLNDMINCLVISSDATRSEALIVENTLMALAKKNASIITPRDLGSSETISMPLPTVVFAKINNLAGSSSSSKKKSKSKK